MVCLPHCALAAKTDDNVNATVIKNLNMDDNRLKVSIMNIYWFLVWLSVINKSTQPLGAQPFCAISDGENMVFWH